MAHLTLRPIHVFTDDPLRPVMTIEPPDTIAADAWGTPIVVTHQGEIHYEATVTHEQVGVKIEPGSIDEIESVSSEQIDNNTSSADEPTDAQMSLAGHRWEGFVDCIFLQISVKHTFGAAYLHELSFCCLLNVFMLSSSRNKKHDFPKIVRTILKSTYPFIFRQCLLSHCSTALTFTFSTVFAFTFFESVYPHIFRKYLFSHVSTALTITLFRKRLPLHFPRTFFLICFERVFFPIFRQRLLSYFSTAFTLIFSDSDSSFIFRKRFL